MDRREFIKKSACGLTGIFVLPACVHERKPYRFFTENEASCVISLTDQIIPEDEYGPGAVYANVVNYIDKQLVEVFSYLKPLYRNGLKVLQKACNEEFKKNFELLEFKIQTELLNKIEKGEFKADLWGDIDQSKFFSTIIDHTMQGFYGSPRHGGNRNYISYRLMDLEYPLVIGQNRYRSENGK